MRRAYLSRAQPRRGHHGRTEDGQPAVLSDREREAVDKDAKEMMRELNWSIEALDSAEKIRHDTEAKAILKKHGSGLGALGSWAAGGIMSGKTPEHLAAEARAQEIKTHRDGVLWYLRQRLQLCGQTQKSMMEARLAREVEKNRSLGTQASNLSDFAAFTPTKTTPEKPSTSYGGDDGYRQEELSSEQLQMFEEGNQDMMKYYESMNESVQYVAIMPLAFKRFYLADKFPRTAQKSLAEISGLQSQLIEHLVTQNEQIDVLVEESQATTQNVEGGNKQLKKATERPSAAKWTFYATSGVCAFLVVWDLIF